MKQLFRFLVVLACLAVADHAAAQTVTIPMIYSGSRIYVNVSKSAPLGEFILDTGATEVLLDSDVASALGVPLLESDSASGAGTQRMQIKHAGPIDLSVAGITLSAQTALVGPISQLLSPYDGRQVRGIIGAPFFDQRVVRIDFKRQQLSVSKAANQKPSVKSVTMSFDLTSGVPILQGALRLPDGSHIPLRLLLDLGAKANLLLAQGFVDEHQLLTAFPKTVTEPLGAGLGGETRYAFARLPNLLVGSDDALSADDLVIGLSVGGTLKGGYYDGLLGAQFLSRYVVTIDYPNRLVTFEPRDQSERYDRFDRSGAFLITDARNSDSIVVHEVVPASPADEAGLSAGDQLTQINGVPTKRLGLAHIRQIFASTSQSSVLCSILRDQKTIEVRLQLHDLL